MVQEAAEKRFPVGPHSWLPYKPATQTVDISISWTGLKGLLHRPPLIKKISNIWGEKRGPMVLLTSTGGNDGI